MPSHTTKIGIQVEAKSMSTQIGGAVAKVSLNLVLGMRTGHRMKKMEMTKKMRVTMDLAS